MMEYHFNCSDVILSLPSSARVSSEFDSVFQRQWKNIYNAGVCHFQLTNQQTRILSGKYRFIAQVNPGKAHLRRRPQNFQSVSPPFDPNQFNFNKARSQEIVLKLKYEEVEEQNFLFINPSPHEFGNSLLVPCIKDCIPQRVTQHGLALLIRLMLHSSDPDLRSGFSSPGAYASVNHQHFHIYYLRERLFLEDAEVEHVYGPCYALKDFPSKGFAFQLENGDIISLARDVTRLVSYLLHRGIAHNIFLTRGKSFGGHVMSSDHFNTLRIFVWARESSFGISDDYTFKPALCELAGHLLMKETSTYETITEKEVQITLENLTLRCFQSIIPYVSSLFSNHKTAH